ncbi:hypothetical protein EXIGLDRAFT_636985 [Exidia glandulosa HHB12029]|uniref:DUF7727 domain-containing protein n=1 Tax=Exidia glandulosa HHB12029 TaxID=1314781 RepID=A0A165Q0B8_EXIGL|nr:hypothetical protein EXIGLDRAFT_636985 [Exidia glandulosa HHB12029]
MGEFIWHQWARYVSITASVYAMWSAYWGIFYRKVFWDFVGGHLRAPGGLQPSSAILPLSQIIVKAPAVQIFALFVSLAMLMLELRLPPVKGTSLGRSWVVRIALLVVQAVLTILYYQGTNAAIWSLIATFGYIQASVKGEKEEDAKQHRGKVGAA